MLHAIRHQSGNNHNSNGIENDILLANCNLYCAARRLSVEKALDEAQG